MLAISTGYYDTLKFFHVLATITWVGSAIHPQALAMKVMGEGDAAPGRHRQGHRRSRQAADHAFLAVSRVDVIALILVVADMVFKPGS